MSGTWLTHKAMLDGMLAEQKAKRAAKLAAVQAAKAAAAPAVNLADPGGMMPESWQGCANGGQVGGPGGIDAGGKPGEMGSLAGLSGLGLNGQSIGGLLGALGGGLVGGPFGGLLGGLAGRGIGGMFGSPAPQATAQPTEPGIGSLGGESFGGSAGAGTFGGGLGDMGAAGMGLGVGDLGAMSGNEIMGWQGGGYTGAGPDGVVQPSMPAGVVHEGEFVIPAHMLAGLLNQKGRRAGPFPTVPRK